MKIISILIIMSGLLISCSHDTFGPQSWTTVEGYVLDSLTAIPVAGAGIYINDTLVYMPDSSTSEKDPWAKTDSAGYYRYRYEGSGSIDIIVKEESYNTKTRKIVPTHDNQHFKDVNFELSDKRKGGNK